MFPKLNTNFPPGLEGLSKKGSINQNSMYSTFDCSKSVEVSCLVIPAQLFCGVF